MGVLTFLQAQLEAKIAAEQRMLRASHPHHPDRAASCRAAIAAHQWTLKMLRSMAKGTP